MPLTRLVTALMVALGMLVTTVPEAAVAGSSEYGRAWRPDGVLRASCHDYRVHYRVKPDNVRKGKGNGGDWALELFLVNRRGEGVGNVAKDASFDDPKRGRATFTLCGTTSLAGRYKVRGKLSVYSGYKPVKEVWIKPGHFRLRRP